MVSKSILLIESIFFISFVESVKLRSFSGNAALVKMKVIL